MVQAELLSKLGCSQFTARVNLLPCLGVQWWLASRPDGWFVGLLEYLFESVRQEEEAQGGFAAFASQLRSTLMWPVEGGEQMGLPPPSLQPPPPTRLFLRNDLMSLSYAEEQGMPLFYLDGSIQPSELPPGVFVLRQSISDSPKLRKDFLVELGLKPTQRMALVEALLEATENHARQNRVSAEEHERHVEQVLFILSSLEQLAPGDREKAIKMCSERLALRIDGNDDPYAAPSPE